MKQSKRIKRTKLKTARGCFGGRQKNTRQKRVGNKKPAYAGVYQTR